MIKFKKGVSVDGVTKECISGMHVAAGVFYTCLRRDLVITSVCDGKHKKNSKHYDGDAFDMRTWIDETSGVQMSPDTKHDIAVKLAYALGEDWDVVVESTHVHIEHDPK